MYDFPTQNLPEYARNLLTEGQQVHADYRSTVHSPSRIKLPKNMKNLDNLFRGGELQPLCSKIPTSTPHDYRGYSLLLVQCHRNDLIPRND